MNCSSCIAGHDVDGESKKANRMETNKSDGKLQSINDLPLYKSKDDQLVYVEERPHLLQPITAKMWEFFEPSYELLRDGYAASGPFYRDLSEKVNQLPKQYSADENQIALAKAVAITVGGMGGYLYGMRRGGLIRRTFYGSIGMVVVAAFCYPHATIDAGRDMIDTVKRTWSE